jgi:hypothetical protein
MYPLLLIMEPKHNFEFCRFRMFFNRLDQVQKEKLLKKYGFCGLDDFDSLSVKNKQLIIIEANTELYNSLVDRIRGFSGYELCLLYNYVEKVTN